MSDRPLPQGPRAPADHRVADDALAEDRLAATAARALARVLDPDIPPPRVHSGSDLIDALCACATAVGLRPRPELVAQARRAGLADPAAVAGLLRVPVRRVVLDGAWWRGDSGPYLVALRTGGYAAALPRARGYDLHSPAAAGRVTTATAAGVGPAAWTITPELPAGDASAHRLLRLSLGAGGRFELVVTGLLALALAVLGVAVPWLAGVVVGTLVPLDATSRIVAVGVVLVLVAIAAFGLAVISSVLVQRATGRIDVRATAMVLLRLVRLPMSFFRQHSAGDLMQRLQGLDQVCGQLAAIVVVLGSSALLGAAGLAVMLVVAPGLAGVVAAVLLLLGVVAGWALRALAKAQSRYVDASVQLTGMTLALVTGIAKLRVAGAERRMHARWTLSYAERQLAANAASLGDQRLGIIAALTPTLVTLVVVLASASAEVPLGLGDFTTVVAAAGQASGALAAMLMPLAALVSLSPLVRAMRPILAEPVETKADAAYPGELRGEVELAAVSFAYGPDQPDVLSDISLRIRPGEYVAVVGPSGSGKSTLVRLVIGLELPTAGGVLYDGRPLERFDADAVRRQIGVVVQSARLAAGTLLENIIGTSARTEEEAWEAARLAGIADDIAAMPMGMQTVVNDGASTFSGGQQQRIMLARALVRRPRIVVLDEATSALDNATQRTVTASLSRLGATRIVVAHRLSTIAEADRIVVLEAGRLVQLGTFDELIAEEGLFARLVGRQRP